MRPGRKSNNRGEPNRACRSSPITCADPDRPSSFDQQYHGLGSDAPPADPFLSSPHRGRLQASSDERDLRNT
jgi:hypothetical protein